MTYFHIFGRGCSERNIIMTVMEAVVILEIIYMGYSYRTGIITLRNKYTYGKNNKSINYWF